MVCVFYGWVGWVFVEVFWFVLFYGLIWFFWEGVDEVFWFVGVLGWFFRIVFWLWFFCCWCIGWWFFVWWGMLCFIGWWDVWCWCMRNVLCWRLGWCWVWLDFVFVEVFVFFDVGDGFGWSYVGGDYFIEVYFVFGVFYFE